MKRTIIACCLLSTSAMAMEKEKGIEVKRGSQKIKKEKQKVIEEQEDETASVRTTATITDTEGEKADKESSSSSSGDKKNIQRTESEIARMLGERLGRRFSNTPELTDDQKDKITKKIKKIGLSHYSENIDRYGILAKMPETPKEKIAHDEKLAELEIKALEEAIINMKKTDKRDTIRLKREKKAADVTLRLGYLNLISGLCIGFITAGISTATLVAFLATGDSSC